MTGRTRRRAHVAATALLALTLPLTVAPRDAHAQALPAVLGFTGGLVGGAYVTTGIYVFKSRATGFVLHSASELVAIRAEALPVVAMPIAGAIVGYHDRHQLGDAATWGTVGLVSGALIGAGFGQLIWGTSEGRWAGGTIGSAAGLAIGAIAGALTYREESGDVTRGPGTPLVTFSVPVGW